MKKKKHRNDCFNDNEKASVKRINTGFGDCKKKVQAELQAQRPPLSTDSVKKVYPEEGSRVLERKS